MKFDPITNELFTDKGEFIKRLHCPYKIDWDNLKACNENPIAKTCNNCEKSIIDTALLSDDQLLEIVQKDPSTCFTIEANQTNLFLISNEFIRQK